MNNQNLSKVSDKLLKANIKDANGDLIEGYPFCASTKNGKNSYWMVRVGCKVDTLTTGGMVNIGVYNTEEIQPKLLKAHAKSFVNGELVQGYPFYAEAETKETSYWMIRDGSTTEDILTHGLVNIIPETISYNK